MDIQQNTLYLTTPASYVARDHLTLQIEVPLYPDDLPRAERSGERASDWKKLSIPIHNLESIFVFGPSTISPPALDYGLFPLFFDISNCFAARRIGRLAKKGY